MANTGKPSPVLPGFSPPQPTSVTPPCSEVGLRGGASVNCQVTTERGRVGLAFRFLPSSCSIFTSPLTTPHAATVTSLTLRIPGVFRAGTGVCCHVPRAPSPEGLCPCHARSPMPGSLCKQASSLAPTASPSCRPGLLQKQTQASCVLCTWKAARLRLACTTGQWHWLDLLVAWSKYAHHLPAERLGHGKSAQSLRSEEQAWLMMNPSQPWCETDEHRSLCLCLRGGGRKSSATCHMPKAHFGQAHPLFLMLPGVTVSLDTQRWKICLQKDGLAAGLRFPQGPSLDPVPDGYPRICGILLLSAHTSQHPDRQTRPDPKLSGCGG